MEPTSQNIPATPRYRALDPEEIIATAVTLGRRISERFPASGLGKVAVELATVCRESQQLSDWLARPNVWMRGAIGGGTEMLALVSKAAALHVQHFDDAETRSTVEDIEDLTLGLSQQILQKIMILDRVLNPSGGGLRDVLGMDGR